MIRQSVEKVKGKQRNHEDFYLPESVRHLGEMPLYRTVAWWRFYLGRASNRDDLSAAFQIDLRRASGILNYLCHRHVGDDITLDMNLCVIHGGHRQLLIHIRDVKMVTARGRSSIPTVSLRSRPGALPAPVRPPPAG